MSDARRPRWLIFGVGNPSRGDDALGPMLIDRLEAWRRDAEDLSIDLALLTDFQWQVEHALDLADIDLVIFVDASHTAAAPFQLERISPQFDITFSTHALSPACVLAVAERLGQTPPRAWLLGIPGRDFELGASLSTLSQRSFETAFDCILAWMAAGDVAQCAFEASS